MSQEIAPTRSLLDEADIVPLAMALVQITGDLSLLDEIAPHVSGPWDYSQTIPPDLAVRIRDRLAAELARPDRPAALAEPDPALLQHMLGVAVGGEVGPEYVPMLTEQVGFSGADAWAKPATVAPLDGMSAIIVGAGVSGICAAVRLKEKGVPCTLFEKNEDVGGTWFENRYPGCAVDTPNHFYQFSFAPNNDWPRYFSGRDEIRKYVARVTDWFGIRPLIRFRTEVVSARFDPTRDLWIVTAKGPDGTTVHEARILVTAVGQLNRPAVPRIPGIETFAGPVVHTAAWNETTDPRGRRVGLIGTGASAVQVGPGIVDDVASLHVFQRSGGWVVRSPNALRKMGPGKHWALNSVPFYAGWYRFQLFWGFGDGLFPALRIDPDWQGGSESVNALNARLRAAMLRYFEKRLETRPDLLAKVVPDYPPYGKRVLADAGWFDMLLRDHVELVTDPIAEIVPHGVRLSDGRTIELDMLVLATGFQASKMLWPMEITGTGGKTIRELWGDDDPRAHLGTTVEGFPNFFVLYGPNTGLGHGGSVTFLAECQINYVSGCLDMMREAGATRLELRDGVQSDYNARMDRELLHFVWSHPSVRSWYRNGSGRITINQPWRLVDYWNMTRRPEPSDYRLGRATG
ncbi:flavin-containing monooxygenase [Pinisolibacter aquiterrae]|uniref:flavin-containing monooxygenase n=1 Tax=Pinisolibacter aquiterrae TaxID=2815579 RepID=UPI001C3E2797|nr:NAD(P)/FAD-dependent oxidoreductase [Pinisolibacter aquiterrae]MBV5266897.1 NAD(P)/FAD-dependent oxidoreductase [Pinisolibacter aquiterrae]MCC8234792.1 NAD(P)/FAD-dependent oxidoreductase [Pinisolibacter aquiterrae]